MDYPLIVSMKVSIIILFSFNGRFLKRNAFCLWVIFSEQVLSEKGILNTIKKTEAVYRSFGRQVNLMNSKSEITSQSN